MIGLSRFEQRILFAIGIVVACSVVGSLLFGYVAVRDAYRMGVNRDVRSELVAGVDARRAYLVSRRELAERTVEGLARDVRLVRAVETGDARALDALLHAFVANDPGIDHVAVIVDDEVLAEVSYPRDGAGPMHRMTRTATVESSSADALIELVVVEPQATFDRFQRSGEMAELFSRLEARRDFVSNVYVGVYMAFVLVIALAAMALGVLLARRVTRQVGVLAEANRRVGRGDLDVRVPKGSDDEIGELIESFNGMVEDLKLSRERIDYLQRIGAWQEFARRLAHEIKNPLTPIQLAAQEVYRSYRGDDPAYRRKLEDASAIIEEEVATLRRLVSEFSSFARLPTAELVDADLRDFLAEIERSGPALLEDATRHEAAPVRLVVEVPKEPLPVRIDAMMLKRGVDNLVRNAVQAVSQLRIEGGGKVVVRASRQRDSIRLTVDDNGPGIPESDRDRIFDPYFTTKVEGTGLGLPIVKKVVLEHGGTVELVASSLGGARFVISLPLAGGSPTS